jgi:hypothetical protein
MTVCIVMASHFYDTPYIDTVFSTREGAERYVTAKREEIRRQHSKAGATYFEIHDVEVQA